MCAAYQYHDDDDVFQQNKAAFERQDYSTMLKLMRPLAEQGNAKAQNNLGFLYHGGFGVPKNIPLAIQWYTKASNQGHALAQYNLYQLYHSGKDIKKDEKTALYWLEQSALSGYFIAQTDLGDVYFYGKNNIAPDYDKARYWYQKAVAQGDMLAKQKLQDIEQTLQQLNTFDYQHTL